MIDLTNLDNYRENNRIEAKKALGGLPHSIWETYSAFANTLGGIILLGVMENKDKSLYAIDLPEPEKLVKEFWDLVNDTKKASVLNSYRRNGEGDYKCTDEELKAMYRDASVRTQDMLVLEKLDLAVFNAESLRSYRQRMRLSRPGHVWDTLENADFLIKLGAAGIGEDGKKHPTCAGLLMFGNEYEIVREFPQFFLDYREEHDDIHRWTDRIVSSSGDWSGNVYDFYFRVYNKLQLDLKTPFEMRGGFRIDDTPVHKAIREALANCLVNADYYGRGGVVVVKKRDMITLTNPGNFRIGIDEAKSGGFSDPRNGAMLKFFNLIDIGERAGSGIPNIYRVWHDQKWAEPAFSQSFDPDRITLSLAISNASDKKQAIKTGDKKIYGVQKELIIGFLTDRSFAKAADIAELLNISPQRARAVLSKLIAEDIVIAEGANRNRTYKLKY